MHWRQYQEMQKVVELGDSFMSYVDRGEGPALVLVHGFPFWGYVWHRLLPILEQKHRVLIPDLPGYGFSDRSDRFDRCLARQAERLELFLKEAGVDRATVVGHELGGGVALRLAASSPKRVERLFLAAPVCYDWLQSSIASELSRSSAARKAPAAIVAKALREALREVSAAPDDDLLDGLLAPYATETGKLSLIRDAAAMDAGQTAELSGLLPSLDVPALVCWGELDRLAPKSAGRRLAWDLPRAQLALLPGAGHLSFIDKQAEFASLLETFLEGALPRPVP